MKQISKQEAVEGLIQVFSAVPFEERKEGSNFYSEKDGTTSFYIDKRNCVFQRRKQVPVPTVTSAPSMQGR